MKKNIYLLLTTLSLLLTSCSTTEKQLDVFTKPEIILAAKPFYPYSAISEQLKGEVVVEFFVDPNGNAVNPKIHRSSNHIFDEAAINAVLRTKFKPATKNGKPISAILRIPIVFLP